MQPKDTLRIRDLEISPPLVMAPMAGVTHNPFRLLVEELGGCGLFYTEMLSAAAVASESPEKSFYLQNSLKTTPLIYQLLVYDKSQVVPALEKLKRCRCQGVDLNLGCTAPPIVKKGGGIALMQDFDRCASIVRELRSHTRLPLTVKLRLGDSADWGYMTDLCNMLESEGVDGVIIHARLKKDRFKRPAKREYIEKVKEMLSVPVIGNGDVMDAESARLMFLETGCDGVMIGRAAVKKPWVFREIASVLWPGKFSPLSRISYLEIYERYVDLVRSFLPEERRLGRLKEFTAYFAQNFQFGHTLWRLVQNATSVDEALEKTRSFLIAQEELLVM